MTNHDAPKGPAMPMHRLLLTVTVAAIALVASLASSHEVNEATLADSTSSSTITDVTAGADPTAAEDGAGEPAVFAVGDLVELGSWQVKVHHVTDPLESTNDFIQPPEGYRWVSIDVEATNLSDQPEVLSSLLCFEIMDGESRSYQQAITGESGASTPDGEIPAGGSRRGTIDYEVPAEATGLQLNFSCDLFSRGTATVAL